MYNHECFYSELVTLITTMHISTTISAGPVGPGPNPNVHFETFQSEENIRKITIYVKSIVFFFSFLGKFRAGDGRLRAGWLAWELARLAGLAGWLELAGRLGRGAGPEA